MRRRRWILIALVGTALALGLAPAGRATFPFRPGGGDIYDYTRFKITNGSCAVAAGEARPPGSDLPENFDCRNDFKLTDYAAQPGDDDYDPLVANNPQELFGVKGSSTNRAWEVTTGRPDVVIAVTDSGIRWDEKRENLVNKYWLNRGELPVPGTNLKKRSVREADVNRDGVFNVKDFATDSRAKDFPDDDNELLDPGDLIRVFSDGVDDDGNGYVDDISGWDFFENDNDPNDDADYGHGTGESEDSAGETETNLDPQCPNCMLMEMRVGDSFVADVNHFAEAAVYATDNGASLIQSALGTLNNTAFAQAAADYAWNHGVLFVASAADESAGHHNFPSALNHTMVMNSVTPSVDQVQVPKTYLAFNGCTNFGGYIWLAVSSTSCSSDAVGQSSGIAGLVYSAAMNAVEKGVIAKDRSGKPLSASEAKQVLRAAGEDIDFSTPKAPVGLPNNFATTLPASMRYVTTEGWDQVTGWGRLNANTAVRLVAAGHIPPEADLTSPRWWQPLGETGTVAVEGRADAPRAGSFTWTVEIAPGVQPPRWPIGDTWTTVAEGESTAPVEGTLASIDLREVRDLIEAAPPVYTPADDPTSRDLPEKDAFRIRLTVRDDRPETPDAIEQRQAFAHHDPTLRPGYPRFLNADGAASPAFEDIDGDGLDELVLPDGNGYVHAYKADGTEAAGWPVRTPRMRQIPTTGTNGYTRGEVSPDVGAAVLLGSPAIADLDGDGRPEVAMADLEGNLNVWDHRGRPKAGFPVGTHRPFSEEPGCEQVRPACDDYSGSDPRDRINTVDHGFNAAPAAGDLDKTAPGLELVVGANDGHVYAFRADGTPVPGWPVLLRDPAKVAAVDSRTHRITHVEGSEVKFGRKVVGGVSLGDVDGDGDLEVAVNVNEEYAETPNASAFREQILPLLQGADLTDTGNTRVYLLHHDGTRHAGTDATAQSVHPDDQAYVGGWPVPIAMITTELLPYVGEGSNGAPVLADTDGDGDLEIGTASIGGPAYLLNGDGTSVFGNAPDGMLTLATGLAEFKSAATDGPTFPSLGGGAFGRLLPQLPPSFVMGASGLRRLLDVILPEQQLLPEDHIAAWDPVTGTFMPGFPAQVNDLQFFNTPTIVDTDGDGRSEVIQSTATYDVRAYELGGIVPAGFPKSTGNWNISTVAAGDIDGDGRIDLAMSTREGNLFAWEHAGPACGPHEWPKYQHDLRNTGVHGTDGRRPGAITGFTVSGTTISWQPTGGDGRCGTPANYVVTVDGVSETLPATATTYTAKGAFRTISVAAVDGAGQKGFPAVWPPEVDARADVEPANGVLPSTGAPPGPPVPLLLAAALAALLIVRPRALAR